MNVTNSFGVEGSCRVLLEVFDITTLPGMYAGNQFKGGQTTIIGAGYNIIPKTYHDELVIKIKDERIVTVAENSSEITLDVSAGVVWDDLVKYCVANGFLGLENMSLIPGSVGAAPVHNIGAYGYEVSDFIESVYFFDLDSGKESSLDREGCEFKYRESIFKSKSSYLITKVRFRFIKSQSFLFSRKVLPLCFKEGWDFFRLMLASISLQRLPTFKIKFKFDAVRDILKLSIIPAKLKRQLVCYIRRRTLHDPAMVGNSGCFFKCPILDKEEFLTFQKMHPSVEYFKHSLGSVKVSACWLLKGTNWAGKEVSGVMPDLNKPVVLTNTGCATPESVRCVASAIQSDVYKKYGIDIEPEAVFL
ncbi:MAG: FAD-binding protein [Colwellia sp.]|jgi:UDP-N-acetylenolpyruvoylglucosamine reductase